MFESIQAIGTTKHVRRPAMVCLAYAATASLLVGFTFAIVLFTCAVLGISKTGHHKPMPVKESLIVSLASLGVVSLGAFVVQVFSGPFGFTTNVVCNRCFHGFRTGRIPFFAGKNSRARKCECGGRLEPAFLWKRDPSGDLPLPADR